MGTDRSACQLSAPDEEQRRKEMELHLVKICFEQVDKNLSMFALE
jgi:hypothetical protein